MAMKEEEILVKKWLKKGIWICKFSFSFIFNLYIALAFFLTYLTRMVIGVCSCKVDGVNGFPSKSDGAIMSTPAPRMRTKKFSSQVEKCFLLGAIEGHNT